MDIKEIVVHTVENGKYRVVFEKAASANKVDGFKVEATGDIAAEVMQDAQLLYTWAMEKVTPLGGLAGAAKAAGAPVTIAELK